MITFMDFKLFTTSVISCLQEKVGSDIKVFSTSVKKNNGIELTGIIWEEKECNTSPAVYIDEFYEEYKKGVAMEEIVEAVYDIFQKHRFSKSVNLPHFMDYEKAKSNIAFKLVNYEKNWELLKEVPHKVFFNLAVIFYYAVQEAPFYGKASILIQNEHLENWGIDGEKLFQNAIENTPKLFPPQIENIENVMLSLLESGLKKESIKGKEENSVLSALMGDKWVADQLMRLSKELSNTAPELSMYVLSNEQKLQGAACMLYPDVLKNFAKEKESDLFILPSSIHEVILLPVSETMNKEAYLDMVMEINRTQVEECEVLADSVYYFKRDTGRIERIC